MSEINILYNVYEQIERKKLSIKCACGSEKTKFLCIRKDNDTIYFNCLTCGCVFPITTYDRDDKR